MCCACRVAEHWRVGAIGEEYAVHKQHVKVHIQVQRRAKAFHQRYRSCSNGGGREASLVDDVSCDR